ncbi:MAG: ribosomal-processing cysteine protease Prp [Clostridia bacterium]|nr:ribosomal-processing cysteine protease Prp [Clostridia bacterium]
MIEANAYQCNEGYCLEVIGHANYATGDDIVCAAVSALVESLAAYLEEYDTECCAEADLADGYALISLSERNAAFDMAACGLAAIADKYPQHVIMRNSYI